MSSAMDFTKIPALTPPPGVVPNLKNPPNRNAVGFAVLNLTIVLSTVAMILGCFSRRFVIHKVHLRDAILLLAYIFWITTLGLVYKWVVDTGFAIHQWDISIANMIKLQHTQFLSIVMFCIFMAFIKTAILLEWRHIFCVPTTTSHNALYWTITAVMVANLLFYLSMVIVQNTQCTPHAYIWDRTIPGGHCWADWSITDICSAVVNFVVDLFILAVPQRVIWSLNMPRRKKAGVAVLFTLGVVGVVAAGARLVLTVRDMSNQDFSFAISWIVMCCMLEGLCGILVLCGPTVPKTLNVVVWSRVEPWLSRSWLSLSASGSQTGFSASGGKGRSANSSMKNGGGGGGGGKTMYNTPTWKNGTFVIASSRPRSQDEFKGMDIEAQRQHHQGGSPRVLKPLDKAYYHDENNSSSLTELRNLSQAELNILRTTEFEVAEGRRSERSEDDGPQQLDQHQHPWAGRLGGKG